MKLSKILLSAMISAGICTSCEPKTEKTVPMQLKTAVKDAITGKDTLKKEDTIKIPAENTQYPIHNDDPCPPCGKG